MPGEEAASPRASLSRGPVRGLFEQREWGAKERLTQSSRAAGRVGQSRLQLCVLSSLAAERGLLEVPGGLSLCGQGARQVGQPRPPFAKPPGDEDSPSLLRFRVRQPQCAFGRRHVKRPCERQRRSHLMRHLSSSPRRVHPLRVCGRAHQTNSSPQEGKEKTEVALGLSWIESCPSG